MGYGTELKTAGFAEKQVQISVFVASGNSQAAVGDEFVVFFHGLFYQVNHRVEPLKNIQDFQHKQIEGMFLPDMDFFVVDNSRSMRIFKHFFANKNPVKEGKNRKAAGGKNIGNPLFGMGFGFTDKPVQLYEAYHKTNGHSQHAGEINSPKNVLQRQPCMDGRAAICTANKYFPELRGRE